MDRNKYRADNEGQTVIIIRQWTNENRNRTKYGQTGREHRQTTKHESNGLWQFAPLPEGVTSRRGTKGGTVGDLSSIYTSASNLRRSLRRDAQACAVTYAVPYTVPDVHLSKNLTARQFYADRKRCDWSVRTPSLCMYLSFVRVYEHCNIV